MKKIGLIGGMSWESTVTYYQLINEEIKKRLGGLHSAEIILFSVDFDDIEKCQSTGDWNKCAKVLGDAAASLEKAGAELILICTNTMHKVFTQVQDSVSVPVIHIADATADELEKANINTIALLGTKYTMLEDFYKAKLIERGFKVIIPNEKDINIVNDIIFNELCLGIISDSSRAEFSRIIDYLALEGAQGVILGCTEIGLLINQENSSIPVFDTTVIHSLKAAELSLEK